MNGLKLNTNSSRKSLEDNFYMLKNWLESTNDEIVFPANRDIHISIPSNAQPIRIPNIIDFNNSTIHIESNSNANGFFLFEKKNIPQSEVIHITRSQIENGDFSMHPALAHGTKLLVLEDLKEWAFRNDSADTNPFYRKDLLLLKNGKAQNSPISQYNTPSTILSYKFYATEDSSLLFQNLHIIRNKNVLAVNVLKVEGYDDLVISNIDVSFDDNNTEEPLYNGDNIFSIEDSSNVIFKDIIINETYSKHNAYGYAFNLINIYNSFFYNIIANNAYWGVMGNRHINTMLIKNSNLNRFDIHCYGKDVKISKTTFCNPLSSINRYNQVSSFFGYLYFEECTFVNFTPLILEPSYQAFTGFDLIIKGGEIKKNANNAIIKSWTLRPGLRNEINKVCLPNLSIVDVRLGDFLNEDILYLYHLEPSLSLSNIEYTSLISLRITNQDTTNTMPQISVCNQQLLFANDVIWGDMSNNFLLIH